MTDLAEAALVVQHVVREPQAIGDPPGVIDVLPRAAGALALDRRAVVVELQGDPDHLVAVAFQQRRGDAGIDTARHGDHHAGAFGRLLQAQAVERGVHGGAL